MEEFVEQLFACGLRQSIEGVAGRVGESGAEAQDFLKLFGGIDGDDVIAGGNSSCSPIERGSGRVSEIAAGDADFDLA